MLNKLLPKMIRFITNDTATVVFLTLVVLITISNSIMSEAYYNAPPVPQHPSQKYRPVIGGLEISTFYNWTHVKTGSLGFPAYKKLDNRKLFYGFITAGHVYDNTIMTVTYQPLPYEYIGFASKKVHRNGADAAFIYIDSNSSCNGEPIECFNESKLLPRVWYNYSLGNGERVATYAFIVSAYEGGLENLIDKIVFKTGYASETTWGVIVGIKLGDILIINGKIYKIYLLKTTLPILRGDSGGFVGRFITSAGAELLGIVQGHWGDDEYSYVVFHNITNIWNIKPLVCPNPYLYKC